MTPRTRLIIVTSPHNPSGVKVDRSTLEGLTALAASGGAHVLVDEVYLDGACLAAGEPPTSRSAARLDGPIVVTSSLTKSYGLAGLRSGWAIAPSDTAERLRRTRDVVDNANSAPADRLAALAWSLQPQLAERTRALLRTNLARAREFFAAHPYFEIPEPPSCSVVFARLAGSSDSEAFVQYMLDQHGVAVAPGRFFESPAHFRVSLAGRPEALEQGFAQLGDGSVFHRFCTV
jgi:aspartate/methionine/tyrosine aminotransferase